MNKTDLIQKVKALDGLSQYERAYLINLVNTKKKYGLVWEDKPEEVEEQLRENLPVLKEVKDKAIVNGEDYPNHILIEGDNLHALTALSFTHEGKIDVIYIDPPYNTGTKDFKYNDNYVDREDSYRHSKWLSFMNKRLQIAKRLLSSDGLIFFSIDENEQGQLKILCNEVFGENNFIQNVIWKKRGGPPNDKSIGAIHEYVLIFAKDIKQIKLNKRTRTEEQINRYSNPDNHPKGNWAADNLMANVKGGRYVKSLHFAIINPDTKEEHYPGKDGNWRYNQAKIDELMRNNEIYFGKDGKGRPKLKRFLKDVSEGVPFSTIWDYLPHNNTASNEIQTILGNLNLFDTPKPVDLILEVLKLSSKNDSIILDFFAGSGTTLHATIQINKDMGGIRQCIIITNNENNICEEVTYERNKRVIQGYTNAKGVKVEGLTNNNLRYYKSEFVGRESSLKNKRELTQLATELLCIKEDCYIEQKIKIKQAKLFVNASVTLLILFDDNIIPDAVELIKGMDAKEIKVYVFSMGSDPYTEDFAEVLDKVTLCALPDAIYKAYQNVLPKKKRLNQSLNQDAKDEKDMKDQSGRDLFSLNNDNNEA